MSSGAHPLPQPGSTLRSGARREPKSWVSSLTQSATLKLPTAALQPSWVDQSTRAACLPAVRIQTFLAFMSRPPGSGDDELAPAAPGLRTHPCRLSKLPFQITACYPRTKIDTVARHSEKGVYAISPSPSSSLSSTVVPLPTPRNLARLAALRDTPGLLVQAHHPGLPAWLLDRRGLPPHGL